MDVLQPVLSWMRGEDILHAFKVSPADDSGVVIVDTVVRSDVGVILQHFLRMEESDWEAVLPIDGTRRFVDGIPGNDTREKMADGLGLLWQDDIVLVFDGIAERHTAV